MEYLEIIGMGALAVVVVVLVNLLLGWLIVRKEKL